MPAGVPVFVPLCGKSTDMVWLAEQGYQVTGVELSELAIQEFFADQQLIPSVQESEGFKIYRQGPYTLLVGDFFDVSRSLAGEPAAVYDRASLVALPPEMRPPYAARFGDLLTPGAPILLLSFAYPQHQMSGPPFAVHQTEVEKLYRPEFEITHLQKRDILSKAPRFAAQGIEYLTMSIYRLIRQD